MNDVEKILENARHHQRAGRWQEANKLYQQALHLQPCQPRILFFFGTLTQQCGHQQKAIDFFRQAIRLAPPQRHLFGSLENSCKEAERFHKAAHSFNENIWKNYLATAPQSQVLP